MKGRVLIIAGSDPSGGAGIQADIKTVTALGGYAASAITAITVQNTRGVTAVHGVAAPLIREQIDAVMSDIGADCIKVGMIGDAEAGLVIASFLKGAREAGLAIVLDPVLGATSGDALAGEGVAGIILSELMPLATIATPNADELATLSGAASFETLEEMLAAGRALQRKAMTGALMLKGGHIKGEEVVDMLIGAGPDQIYRNPRLQTTSTHGTGCTLASALATGLAQGMSPPQAAARAVAYVHEAIRSAPGLGGGHGPLNHGFALDGRWRKGRGDAEV